MKSVLPILALFLFSICTAQIPTDGLIAYWPLDGNYNDLSGSGLNATNYTCTATSDVYGNGNSAMNFTNTTFSALDVNQYGFLTLNSLLNFSGTQDFSIDFNVYVVPHIYHYGGGIFDYGLNDHWGYALTAFDQTAGNNLRIYVYYGSKMLSTNSFALSYNTWYHITFVKSGASGKIYINGTLNSSVSDLDQTTPIYSAVTGAYFGAIHSTNYNPPYYAGLNGKLDEFRIYNRALTNTEIQNITSVLLNTSEHSIANKNTVFYPNPAEDKITFNSIIQSVEVYDTCGKKIAVSLLNNQLDLTPLSKGVYFIKYLNDDNIIATAKLIKK